MMFNQTYGGPIPLAMPLAGELKIRATCAVLRDALRAQQSYIMALVESGAITGQQAATISRLAGHTSKAYREHLRALEELL
jgi:hypothetical protein